MDARLKITLTGARGFIGARLRRRLAADGHDVWTLGPRAATEAPAKQHLTWARDEALPDAADGDVLVHLAWDTSDRGSRVAQAAQLRVAAHVADAVHRFGAVVGLGTSDEYGDRSGTLRESDALEASRSPYGWGKAAAHELIRAACRGAQVPLTWARLFTVYGPGQEGPMLLPYVVRRAAAGEPATLSDGRQIRDFVHVDDVVEGLTRLVHARLDHALNLGRGRGNSVREAVEELATHLGYDGLRFGAGSRRQGEPEVRVASVEALRSMIGWAPSISLSDGMRSVAEYARGER